MGPTLRPRHQEKYKCTGSSVYCISVARGYIDRYLDIEKTLKNTVSKGEGLGGIDTRGVAKLYH